VYVTVGWFLMTGLSVASVIYVDANATGGNNGSSWANAYTNLQTALTAAGSGTEIWVAQGTYYPGTNRTASFQLKADVALYGGFNGTETMRSSRSPTSQVAILSGDIGASGVSTDNCYHVLTGATGAVLDGFTVTGGFADGPFPHLNGAGLYNSNASPTIVNCVFASNSTANAGSGGAIFNLTSSPTITNCTFVGNSGYWGGAICNLNGGSPMIGNCLFTSNNADFGGGINNENCAAIVGNCVFVGNGADGGGINNRNCSPTILNCVFHANSASEWNGAGMRQVGSSGSVLNCVFVGNRSPMGHGGGLFNHNATSSIINCTFYDNRSEGGNGGGIYNGNIVNLVVKNSILWSNVAVGVGSEIFNTNSVVTFTTCDIDGALNGAKCGGSSSTDGGGNLAVNPRFVNPLNPAGADGLFITLDDGLQLDGHFAALSPCIDKATNTGAPAFDILSLARPQMLGVDIGAYEVDANFDGDGDGLSDFNEYYIYRTNPASADTDGDGIPDGWEVTYKLNALFNDANDDYDLDGVTNLQEYQNRLSGYDPTKANSHPELGDDKSDYERLYGKKAAQYYYDKLDRLVGVDYNRGSNGFAIAYVYDGNGNILRQVYLQRNRSGDRLPDIWKFLHGLSVTNPIAYTDPNGAGWTAWQYWKSGADLTGPNSIADLMLGATGSNIVSFSPGFAPSNFVMGIGQLDSGSADEIVIGADGNPGSVTNSILILTQLGDGNWSTNKVFIGSVGVTSIAVGQLTGSSTPAIYLGLRELSGSGSVVEVKSAGNIWSTNLLTVSASPAYLSGFDSSGQLLATISPIHGPTNSLYALVATNGGWKISLTDTNSASRCLAVSSATTNAAGKLATTLRLLDSGGIQAGAGVATDFIGVPAQLFGTGGDQTPGSTHSATVSDGNISLAAWVNPGTPYQELANAWAQSSQLWSQGFYGCELAVGGYVSENRYFEGVARVLYGATTILQASNEDLDREYAWKVQLVRVPNDVFYRVQNGTNQWSAWTRIDPSGALRFEVSANEGRVDGDNGHTTMSGSVRYVPLGYLSAQGTQASGDYNGSDAFYRSAVGRWYFKTPAAGSWLDSLNYARGHGGNLVAIRDATDNSWVRGKFSGEFSIGLCRDTSLMPWHWLAGGSATYTNWNGGAPTGNDLYSFMRTDGTWEASSNAVARFGVFETDEAKLFQIPITIPEPLATRTNNWRGQSLSPGFIRQINGGSAFYSFVDDKNTNGVVDAGDDFVTTEYLINTNYTVVTSNRVSLTGSQLAQSYGLACANILNSSNKVFFTAEPDGNVYSWTLPTGSNQLTALTRQLFDGHHQGKAWHQLSAYRSFDLGEGLAGLLVDPVTPDRISLILWPPRPNMPTLPDVPQTAPQTEIMPTPNSGGAQSLVNIRVSDAEGNASTLALQYSTDGGSCWSNATVSALDGGAPDAAVTAMPSGTIHVLTWNAGANLPAGFSSNVLLHACARDVTLRGDWSPSVVYQINIPADTVGDGIPDWWRALYFGGDGKNTNSMSAAIADPDGDGQPNLNEYFLGTNPTNSASTFRILSITQELNDVNIVWQAVGGRTNVVQAATSPGGIYTNISPWIILPGSSEIITNYLDLGGATNLPSRFYKIKLVLP